MRVGDESWKIISIRHSTSGEARGLKIAVRKLGKRSEATCYAMTCLTESDLSANYYGASFSPKIYPGQRAEASLFVPEGGPDCLTASIFCHDANSGTSYRQRDVILRCGESTRLEYSIPRLENACISRVGIRLKTRGQELAIGSLILEYLTWSGTPDFYSDFSRERKEAGSITQWTFHSGFWRLENGCYAGSGASISETYTGDVKWNDYSYSVLVVPILGEHHLINLRVQGARRSYAFGFSGKGRIVLYKKDGEYRILASAEWNWKSGESYRLMVAASGDLLVASVEGAEVFRVRDTDAPYLNGQIGLSNFAACKSLFRSIDLRPMAGRPSTDSTTGAQGIHDNLSDNEYGAHYAHPA
jgi:hypothetical protein